MTDTKLLTGAPCSVAPINDEAVSDSSVSNPPPGGNSPSISQRKLEANWQNSRLSTGPRTHEGKKISSRNAASHGLLVKDVVSAGDGKEHQADFDTLLADFRDCLEPASIVEDLLAREIAISYWRSARAVRCEKGYVTGADRPVKESERSAMEVATLEINPYPADAYNSLLKTSGGLAFLLRRVEETKRAVGSSGYVPEQLRRWLTPEKNWHHISGKQLLLATLEKEASELTTSKRQVDDAGLYSEDIRRDCWAIPSKEVLDRFYRYETSNVRHRYKVEARLEKLQARRRENAKINSERDGDSESPQETRFCETKPTGSDDNGLHQGPQCVELAGQTSDDIATPQI